MQRRDILKRAGAATTVGLLGGCLSRNGGSPGGSGSDGNDTTTTTTNGATTNGSTTAEGTTKTETKTTTSTTGGNATIDRSLKVISAECGTPKNEASIEFKDSNKTVVITGTIPGSDSCARPTLKVGKTDPKKDTFMAIIGTKKKSGSVACSECITAIKYRATLTFAGSAPESVKVTHKSMGNSKVVTSADSKSTTTTAGK